MEKTLSFCIDHFSFATPRRMEAAAIMRGLGFVTGDTSVDRSTHFIFDNVLTEICYRREGELAEWQGNSIEVGKLPRIHSLRLSNRGTDPNTARDALLAAGIPGVGPVNQPSSQRVKYGAIQGIGRYQTFFLTGLEPFTDVLFGVTTQLTKELIVDNPTKYAHVNGARRVSELVFYCPSSEIFAAAEDTITRLYNALAPVTDQGHNLDTVRLVDRDSYVEEFGAEPPAEHHFPAVAALYSGCDLEYVREAAADTGLPAFAKNNRVYVDTRDVVGCFSVFEA